MKKYDVVGTAEVVVHVVVKAKTEEEAIKKAKNVFGGIHAGLGNGGDDKLICVNNLNESIYIDDGRVEFDDATEIDDI